MTPRRVLAMQELRRSNASGPHRDHRPDLDEPCTCATTFVCLALRHDDLDQLPTREATT